jgi:tetratricopeptide (TPR) repeat protein
MAAKPAPERKPQLRRERELRCWTRERAADELNVLTPAGCKVDGNTFYRWEERGSGPGPFYARYLCQLYERPPESLGLVRPGPGGQPTGTLSAVERREFLRLLGGVGLGSTVRGPDPNPWERLEHALRRGGPLDGALVARLETQTRALHQLEETVPARQVFSRLMIHLDRMTELLQRSASARLRRQLMSVAGDSAALGAWVAWDMADSASATRLYAVATTAAREADDPALRACILAYASYAAPSPANARMLLEQARAFLDPVAFPAGFAWIAGRQAEEAAAQGDARQALKSLEQAMHVYGTARLATERPWTTFLDGTRMQGFAISTYARLGDTDSALRSCEALLDGPGSGKKHALVLADVAGVYLQQGQLEPALHLAERSVEVVLETQTTVGLDRLRLLRPGLRPWLHVPGARDMDERLEHLSASPG